MDRGQMNKCRQTIRVDPPAGKRLVGARLVDGRVVIDVEDAPPPEPKLMTPDERARWQYGGQSNVSHFGVMSTANAVRIDRVEIWEKACLLPRYIAVQREDVPVEMAPGRVMRGDWNCISLEDLERLLKGGDR